MRSTSPITSTCVVLLFGIAVAGQAPAPPPTAGAPASPPAAQGRGGGRGGPAVVSPQIEADGRVTFRVLAPQATAVTVNGDINGSLVPLAASPGDRAACCGAPGSRPPHPAEAAAAARRRSR